MVLMNRSGLIRKPGLWFERKFFSVEIPSTSLTAFVQWLPPICVRSVAATRHLTHSFSGSTTRQTSFPHCLHLPRSIKVLSFISAVSRRIVTEPRHLLQKTLSRIFFWAHSGIFFQRSRACGVNVFSGWIGCSIFTFLPRIVQHRITLIESIMVIKGIYGW
jgi:hypothetical protein